jgi:tight adherence protein B
MQLNVTTVVILLSVVSLFGLLIALLRITKPGSQSQLQMRNLVHTQRVSEQTSSKKDKNSKGKLIDTIDGSKVEKPVSATITLERKLVYAQWNISPYFFRIFQVVIGIATFSIFQLKFNIVVQIVSLFTGVFIMNTILDYLVNRRFKSFDKDYPQFLMSLAGLIKTGMNPMTAIAAAAQGVEPGALLRNECEMMLERMRYGVTEDQSIGSFAEDILHPEAELFVQALLLSKKVGGTLSDTLDRVSRQARRRQYFRAQAVATVALQRGSIWFIIAIMVFLELYLLWTYPAAVIDSIKDPTGWQVWQFGLLVILVGVIWVRKVTEIKV